MFDFRSARNASVAACALLAAGSLSPAYAKKAPRQASAAGFSATDMIPIPKFSSQMDKATAGSPSPAPARFFTINGALARRDSGRALDTPLQLATTLPAEKLADVLEKSPVANLAE